MRRRALLLTALLAAGCTATAEAPAKTPAETPANTTPSVTTLGPTQVTAKLYAIAPDATIAWHATLDDAKAASRADGKPIMVFFEFDN